MTEWRTTSADHREKIGESKWMHPAHLIHFEVETAHGIRRRSMPGIKSPSIFESTVNGELTDRKISNYIRNGTYRVRHQFMAEKKKQKQISSLMPRLVYDCSTQDFVLVQ